MHALKTQNLLVMGWLSGWLKVRSYQCSVCPLAFAIFSTAFGIARFLAWTEISISPSQSLHQALRRRKTNAFIPVLDLLHLTSSSATGWLPPNRTRLLGGDGCRVANAATTHKCQIRDRQGLHVESVVRQVPRHLDFESSKLW